MSEVIDMKELFKTMPADNLGEIADAFVKTNRFPDIKMLPLQGDIDADNLLTDGCTMYLSTDMGLLKGKLINFPFKKSLFGGICFIVTKQGSYFRQIAIGSKIEDFYIRKSKLDANMNQIWPNWYQLQISEVTT